ncbi:DNA-binding protein [Candidatus Enterococcus ikei]|uniref:DNA-binding protein n=1 Tax=Candidatus Enterococcus ikei TaxID=2815326 RepID=A0ABS3GUV0_9ENTE|nr:DNA-binding protein [Enterococcus sp. DIV0869a]MBO0439038.1 DNA-binding protein [Enterococcus sp. DIV0869a]
MFLNFIGLTLFFSIGILIANGISLISTKGRRVKSTIALMIIELFLIGGFLFVALPSKTLSTILWINLIGAVVASGLLLAGRSISQASEKVLNGGRKKVGTDTTNDWSGRILGLSIAAMVLLFIVSSITKVTAIDDVYQTIPLKTEEKAEVLTSTKETPIAIAPKTAKRKMLQKFSVIPNSNMFTLDGITAQVVNGEYVYVATVEFNGFFKWSKLGAVPGYFIISATDINAQPKFVEKPIIYTPSAYFGKDAARKIYAAYPNYAATGKINLEIDEKDNPFYIQTLYKEYGVSGRMNYDEFKTAVLNATTGEVKVYDSKEAPSFVDAPITSSAANSINEYFGRYSQGWWNQTIFGAKKDVKIPTENGIYASGQITPMMNKEGSQLLYFTDFTSGDEDQDSALGYSLIDARTGKVTYYRDTKVGIMDSDGAISIAAKIYPEKKWKASMPVLYNIDGVPTWIVSLMDSKGIFKKYVYVNAVDNDIVVDADAAQNALDAYRIELATKGSNNTSTDAADLQKVKGTVSRVTIVAGESQTVVSFLLENEKTIYSVTTNNSPMALFLKEGDKVEFQAVVTAEAKAASIENLSIEGLE